MTTTTGSRRDCELSAMFCDDDINCALARIDAAVSNCYPDHQDDADTVRELSHRAWDTLRTFRQEVLDKTKELLGEEDTKLLDPGEGPKALKELLGRVLEYTEARSRFAVETMRMEDMKFFNRNGAFPDESSMQRRREGKPLTCFGLEKGLERAVWLHVERVVDAAEVKLEIADRYRGPVDAEKWGGVAFFVYIASKRVDASMEGSHKTVASFEERLAGKDRAIRIEAAVVEGNKEGKREREELGAGIKLMLNRLGLLQKQIDGVLREMNAVRIHQESGTCPRGFFLVPADKSTWSCARKVDSFSNLYTRNVQLFFVCRMFFEDLKEAAEKAEADRNALIDRRSDTNYAHEFSDPIALELPKRVVAERLHAIRVSVKIVKILVDAASLGLSLGNVIPSLNFKEQDELLNVVQSHLVLAEDEAAGGEPAEDLNLMGSSMRWLKKFLKCRPASTRPGNARSFTKAHQALQGYLDKEHPGVWQDKVRPKLSVTRNMSGTNFAYICEKTSKHKLDWTGKL